MKWRNEFEAEMGIAEKRAKENEANRKLTGRELFLKDQTLLDSDIRFLNENGDSIDSVKIDESMYTSFLFYFSATFLLFHFINKILFFFFIFYSTKFFKGLFQNLDLEEDLPSDEESDDPDWKP